MKNTAFLLFFLFSFSFSFISFSQETLDCETLHAKIHAALYESKTMRMKSEDFSSGHVIKFELDSNRNSHIIDEFMQQGILSSVAIIVKDSIYYSASLARYVDKFNRGVDTISKWEKNKRPIDFNSKVLNKIKNDLNTFFDKPISTCKKLSLATSLSQTYDVYEVSIKREIFRAYLNTKTQNIQSLQRNSSSGEVELFFDFDFRIKLPDFENNKNKRFGFNFFIPADIFFNEYDPNEIQFEQPDVLAKFKDGEASFFRILSSNIRYPPDARANNIQGSVFVSFIVEVDGSISNFRIYKSINKELDAEALRVTKLIDKKWEPAKLKGEKIRSRFIVPIKFRIN